MTSKIQNYSHYQSVEIPANESWPAKGSTRRSKRCPHSGQYLYFQRCRSSSYDYLYWSVSCWPCWYWRTNRLQPPELHPDWKRCRCRDDVAFHELPPLSSSASSWVWVAVQLFQSEPVRFGRPDLRRCFDSYWSPGNCSSASRDGCSWECARPTDGRYRDEVVPGQRRAEVGPYGREYHDWRDGPAWNGQLQKILLERPKIAEFRPEWIE